MHLVLDQAFEALTLSLAAGLALAAWVYYKSKKSWPKGQRFLLATLRGLFAFAVALLLFDPLFRSTTAEETLPDLFVAVDRSASMNTDSAAGEMDDWINRTLPKLEERYRVEVFGFGRTVLPADSTALNQGATDLSLALREAMARKDQQKRTDVLIISDGIFNLGTDPRPTAGDFPGRIHTLALGDSVPKSDARITGLRFPSTVFLNNLFAVDGWLDIHGLPAGNARVVIRDEEGKELAGEAVRWEGNSRHKFQFRLEALKTGIRRYSISTEVPEGDAFPENNTQWFSLEVAERRKVVWVLAEFAHPDQGAWINALKNFPEYEVILLQSAQAANKAPEPSVILAFRPSSAALNLLKSVRQRNPLVGIGLIPSDPESWARCRAIQSNLKVAAAPGRWQDAGALPENSFTLFRVEEDDRLKYAEWPPVRAPFWEATTTGQVLFRQRIGAVNTSKPFWVFGQEGQRKTFLLAAEGLWRWRLENYRTEGNTLAFDRLVLGSVRYLAQPQDNERLKTETRRQWFQGEEVRVEAIFTNATGEQVTDAEITLQLRSSGTVVSNYTFTPSGDRYLANLGRPAPGSYKFTARTEYGGETFTSSGSFAVEGIDLEMADGRARPEVLREMSSGVFARWADKDQLTKHLLENAPPGQRQVHEQLEDPTRWLWLLFALAALLLGEWTLRRINGTL